MTRIHLSVVLGLASALAIVEAPACKPGQPAQVVQLLTPAGACIASALLSGGVSDPLAIVAACAGVTLDDVIAVVEMLLSQSPDGGAAAQRLADVHTRALGLQAAKAGAK